MSQKETEQKLFNFSKPPILMLGSGISKRYLEEYKTWDCLLQSVAKRMSIDKLRYIAYKHKAENEPGQFGTLPQLAMILRDLLIDNLVNGTIKAQELFVEENEIKMYEDGIDPFKILIASKCSKYNIINSAEVDAELTEMRKLINIVPAIITTNYDCFLEEQIFKEFQVYSSVSDYYLSDSEGIGEVFKIHGTIKNPESMVVTTKDYENYVSKSQIISAKILSLICDYPLLIMGYSLSDSNITEIIYNIMSSLDDNDLEKIRNNIVFLTNGDNDEPIIGTRTFNYEGKDFTLRTITLKDYSIVYKELNTYSPSTSPKEVRKLRQLVKNIVLTSEPTQAQFVVIGIDNLNDQDAKNITLIVTEKSYGKILKEFEPIGANKLVNDYLSDSPELNPELVIDYFTKYTNLQTNVYIPLYYYISKAGLSSEMYPVKVKDFIKMKKNQLSSQILKAEKYCDKHKDTIENMINDASDYNKPLVIMYHLNNGSMSINEARTKLIGIKNLLGKGIVNFDTNFKAAVTLLS